MFVEIEVGASVVVKDPDGDFTVSAFDANHCPGDCFLGCLILFWSFGDLGSLQNVIFFPLFLDAILGTVLMLIC